jgi:hypothetical protein
MRAMATFLLGIVSGASAGFVFLASVAAVTRYRQERRRRYLRGQWHSRECLLVRFPDDRIEGVPGARMWCNCGR